MSVIVSEKLYMYKVNGIDNLVLITKKSKMKSPTFEHTLAKQKAANYIHIRKRSEDHLHQEM